MKTLLKYLKTISYLFVTLVLFQSCVAYQASSYSTQEISELEKERIKIKTIDGKEYKLRWIEENGDNIVSIIDTKRTFIPVKKIAHIKTIGPDAKILDVKSLTTYKGNVMISAIDKYANYREYNFVNIELQDSLMRCLELIGKDTATTTIPKNQIESIRVENRAASHAGNVLISLGGIVVLIFAIGMIDVAVNGPF